MAIIDTIRKRAERYRAFQHDLKEVIEAAADDAKRVAMERTPHKGDAGFGLTTGDLASHWNSSVEFDGVKTFTVYLANSMQYASFVNDGHRMVPHFVPWLRIDPSGVLRRERPEPGEPLFGLTVGTKTRYVEPEPMVQPAVEEFFKRYRIGLDKVMEKYK